MIAGMTCRMWTLIDILSSCDELEHGEEEEDEEGVYE